MCVFFFFFLLGVAGGFSFFVFFGVTTSVQFSRALTNRAKRLSRAIGLPRELTLARLLSGASVPVRLADDAQKARAALDALLAEAPSMHALSRRVDELLENA